MNRTPRDSDSQSLDAIPTARPVADGPIGQAVAFSDESPLGPDDMAAYALAERRFGKIRTALNVAMVNAVCLGIFGALSLLFGLGRLGFGRFDWLNLVMGGALCWMCCTELRGRAMLRRCDVGGGALLARNQLALMALVIAYAGWMMHVSLAGPSPFAEITQIDPRMGRTIERMARSLTIVFYAALIAGTVICQGLMARYYLARAATLRDYLADAPAWVVELQRRRAGA